MGYVDLKFDCKINTLSLITERKNYFFKLDFKKKTNIVKKGNKLLVILESFRVRV